jgi:hypothetical protein
MKVTYDQFGKAVNKEHDGKIDGDIRKQFNDIMKEMGELLGSQGNAKLQEEITNRVVPAMALSKKFLQEHNAIVDFKRQYGSWDKMPDSAREKVSQMNKEHAETWHEIKKDKIGGDTFLECHPELKESCEDLEKIYKAYNIKDRLEKLKDTVQERKSR